MSNNKGILVVIAVILLGILGVIVYDSQIKKSPFEKAADSVSEAAEEIGDEIDDHTTTK